MHVTGSGTDALAALGHTEVDDVALEAFSSTLPEWLVLSPATKHPPPPPDQREDLTGRVQRSCAR